MKAMFDGFQNKSIDPSLFADDFVDVGTGFEEADRKTNPKPSDSGR